MQILNDLVDRSIKLRSKGLNAVVEMEDILAIAKAFVALGQRAEAAEAYAKSLNDIIENRESDLRAQAVDIECALQLIKRLERQVLGYQEKLAELKKQEPIGRVERGEANDNNEYPDVRVVCLHNQADWINFQDGTELFLRAAPAINLAQLVPDEMTPKQASRSYRGEVIGYRDGFNACIAAMIDKLENHK